MSDDREVLREIWNGKIPVCFSLAADEVTSVEQPETFYLIVPRLSYLPLITDKVQRHFKKYIGEEKTTELWLEYEGQPLKWHYPAGVLFDMYGSENQLPWNITVHFQDFPEQDLLHCQTRDAVEAHFMSSIKEADSLKHRAQIINSMQKRDHKQLWSGLCNNKFDQFWSINRKLMEHTGDEPFKHIPFRIYQCDKPVIQKLFKPTDDKGEPNSLFNLLHEFVPHALNNEGSSDNYRVLIQGITVPLETPIQWISEHLSHPDNFLHICITRST